jgi:regulatory protein
VNTPAGSGQAGAAAGSGRHGGGRPALSLEARALQWLAQREHSRAELRRKLLRRARLDAQGGDDDPAPQVEQLLDRLEAERHLSDTRFAESRVHARAARYGNLRIRQELAQHGVAPDAAAMHALQASEFDRARALRERRYGAALPADAAERLRQMRFLAGRGFSAEVIRRVVGGRAAGD